MQQQLVMVWFRQSAMLINAHIAQELGIDAGHVIRSEPEFWLIFGRNATENLRLWSAEIEAEKNAPN